MSPERYNSSPGSSPAKQIHTIIFLFPTLCGKLSVKAFLIALVCLDLLAPQSQLPTGSVRGTVTSDSTRGPIVGARIALEKTSYVSYTDSNGAYLLAHVPVGPYNLTISAPSYAKLTFRQVVILPAFPIVIRARLRSAALMSDTTIEFEFRPPPTGRGNPDNMPFYQPDSSIHFKIRIVNPERQPKAFEKPPLPDSSILRRLIDSSANREH